MLARQLARRSVVTQLPKRRFGSDSGHYVERMTYTEWADLNKKLADQALPETERAVIQHRFKEARLCEDQMEFFQERHAVRSLTEEEFTQKIALIKASPYAETQPTWLAHQIKCMEADRANVPRPDAFKIQYVQKPTFTKEELGTGNYAQKLFNEHMYELQNHPALKNKLGAGANTEFIRMDWIGKQSLIGFAAACYFATYASVLYRKMYIEKYNLWDMINWESRVICADAFNTRGW